jgi:catechol 2,3-dioxygenase-like lactoylglutathione lyase family enzyme
VGFVCVEEVVVPVADVARALSLYCRVLRFEVVVDEPLAPGTPIGLAGGNVPAPGRSLTLRKPGVVGGGIRVVTWDGLVEPEGHGGVRQAGAYAFTLFARGLDDRLEEASQAGFDHTGSHSYVLPGQAFSVSVAVVAGPAGINVAMVEYQPKHHRCVLGTRPDLLVSEIATVGWVVEDMDAALALHRDGLGASIYFDQAMGGPSVEFMAGLDPGHSMRVAFARGESRANARIELIERVPGGAARPEHPPVFSPGLIVADPASVPGARVVAEGLALVEVAPGIDAELRATPRASAPA